MGDKITRRELLKLTVAAAGVLASNSTIFSLPGCATKNDVPDLKEVMFYEKGKNDVVDCLICPRLCRVAEGRRGYCGNKENRKGTFYNLAYAQVCALHIDPIEKKPFHHFLPGAKTLSLATAGCNFSCQFCQNWNISQSKPEDLENIYLPPEKIIELAKGENIKIISFTYSEPIVFYEYMYDIAKLANSEGIASVMISNGFINEKPLIELCKHLSAVKIDLKSFSEEFYKKICNSKLQPVLDTLVNLKKIGIWYEIVVLLIPTLNDGKEEIKKMCEWINKELGSEVPIHFSRFTPMYKLTNLPRTPIKTLEVAREIALDCGLKYVYLGNVTPHQGESTYCPNCHKMIIKRVGWRIEENHLKEGKCKYCETKIPGVWNL